MSGTMTLVMHASLFVGCIAAAAFLAGSETALLSVSLSSWDKIRRNHPPIERAYQVWTGDPSLVLATLLFGNTLASLGASVVATSGARVIAAHFAISPGMLLFLTSLFAGATILIFGEILPKLYARHFYERFLARGSSALILFVRTVGPALSGLSGLSNAIKRAVSRVPAEPLVSAEDLRHAISAPQVEGLPASARRMLSNIIAFEQVKVHEVMIPRNQIVAVRMEQNSERMFEHIVRTGFSRVPIYFGTIDNILGIVYAKDLLVEWRSSGLLVLEDLLRPPFRIAPEAPISALLQGFRQGHHLAVVSDSRGRTQGIITVEDVVEAIVGDIADEFDQPR
jgi:putative hemolysin